VGCKLVVALHGDIVETEWLHVGMAARLVISLGILAIAIPKLVNMSVVLFDAHCLHLILYFLDEVGRCSRGRHALLE